MGFKNLVLLLFTGLLISGSYPLFGQTEKPPLTPVKEAVEMWSVPQTMPYSALCANLQNRERKKCHDELITGIIYENLRWPAAYRETCAEGMAVVFFKVQTDGTLTDFKVVRKIAPLLDAEALRLVKLMAEQTSPWVPGTQGLDKKPVVVQFNMPVKFKLE